MSNWKAGDDVWCIIVDECTYDLSIEYGMVVDYNSQSDILKADVGKIITTVWPSKTFELAVQKCIDVLTIRRSRCLSSLKKASREYAHEDLELRKFEKIRAEQSAGKQVAELVKKKGVLRV